MKYTIPGVPPSLNKFAGRGNTWEYREKKNMWKNLVALCCRPRPDIPPDRAEVTIRYYFPDERRRDPDNYCGKMILDGLTAAGMIADDDFCHIDLTIRRGGVDPENPRTEVEIVEIGE